MSRFDTFIVGLIVGAGMVLARWGWKEAMTPVHRCPGDRSFHG